MNSSEGEILTGHKSLIPILDNIEEKNNEKKNIGKENKNENKANIINTTINDKNENRIKKVKSRNPSIDLARLIGMYGVVINHILYFGNAFGKYKKYSRQLKIFHIIFFFHNNCFILYFGMYLFLPVINKGISILTKSELKLVVISTIGIFTFWKDFNNDKKDVFSLKGGYSPLWFLTLYLVGAYIGKYKLDLKGIKKFKFYFICGCSYFSSTLLYYKLINNQIIFGNCYFGKKFVELLNRIVTERYDSILKVIQSISVILILMQINYNKYFAKIITILGPHAFGIYLIHNNKYVNSKVISNIFEKDPINGSLFSTIKIVSCRALEICAICIGIDYIRDLFFNILRIRKICNILEKKAIKIFG